MTFARYPTYVRRPGEWYEAVPTHWPIARTKYVCEFLVGWTPPTGNDLSYVGDNLWANISDLGPKILSDTAKRISDAAIAAARISKAPKGSLLFSFKLSIGQVSIAGTDLYTNEAIAAFLPSERLILSFAYYAFPIFLTHNAAENIYGAKLLNQDLIRNAYFPLPSTSEQIAIGKFLDYETGKIDALSSEQQRLINLLKEKRQAVISHAVTRGLDSVAPVRESGVEWLGDVPAHWQMTRLRHLFRQVKRQEQTDKKVLSVYREYGVIEKDSRDDNMNKTPDDLSAYQLVNPGDLVVNKMKAWQGSLGISHLEGITSPDYMVFSPRHGESPAFIHWLLRSRAMVSIYRSISNGIRPSQWRLEPDLFLGLSIFLPPREEQNEIDSFIREQISRFDDLIAEAQQAINLLQERRSALISAAVTGRIDIRGIYPAEAA